jgi:thiamine-monophosphate kinase
MLENRFTPLDQNHKTRLESSWLRGNFSAVLNVESFDAVEAATLLKVSSEGTEFDFNRLQPSWAGRKMAVQLLGEAVALSGNLERLHSVLKVPGRMSVEVLEQWLDGFASVLPASCKTKLELKAGPAIFTASVQALVIPNDRFLQEHKPESGDAICVTGELGSAIAGLHALKAEVQPERSPSDIQVKLAEFEEAVRRYVYPEVDISFSDAVAESGVRLSSCLFLVDGLVETLERSAPVGMQCIIDAGSLPIRDHAFRAAKTYNGNAFEWALHGGDDHEFVFTLPETDVEKLRDFYPQFRVIGMVTKGDSSVSILDKDGVLPQKRG